MIDNLFHATPYDISATGFYFKSYEEYLEKSQAHKNAYGDPVEEYEIQFIEGDNYRLFEAIGIHQANLKDWFETYEDLENEAVIKLIFLTDDMGYSADQALDKLEDVTLFEGTKEDYAHHYIEETGLLDQMPENLRYYFDYEAFARDLSLNGDISEFYYDGTTYIIWGG